MIDPSRPGLLKKVFIGPWGLRSGWRLLIFNFAFLVLFGIVLKLVLTPIVGKDPEWTATNFILIEAVSLIGAAACIFLMAKI